MGTEVCSTVDVGSIVSQLENAKRGLQKIDENIKKVIQTSGRFVNDRNSDRNFQNIPNESSRGAARLNRNSFYQDSTNNRSFEDDRQGRKRPQQETKTVFSRLSARTTGDSDGEEEDSSFSKKPRISSQVIRELPTKQEVLKAQAGDEVSKARNRRMFGSLLGTLQKFKQEEIVLKNKEDKKAKVEKKIEEQAKQEKENQKRERQNLFADREIKKATIKALEAKMVRMQSYEVWENAQKPLLNFIQTKWKPYIYWLPKKMNTQAKDKLEASKKKQEKMIEEKQKQLKEELEVIEQRCLRSVKLPPGVRRQVSLSSDQDQSLNNDDSMDTGDIFNDSSHSNSKIKIKIEDDQHRKKDENSCESEKSPHYKVIKEEKNREPDKNNGEVLSNSRRHDDSSDEHPDDAHGNSNDDEDGDDDNHNGNNTAEEDDHHQDISDKAESDGSQKDNDTVKTEDKQSDNATDHTQPEETDNNMEK